MVLGVFSLLLSATIQFNTFCRGWTVCRPREMSTCSHTFAEKPWWRFLSAAQCAAANRLILHGQTHIFQSWDDTVVSKCDTDRFFAQVDRLDTAYPGGIVAYVEKARSLLADAAAGVNPFHDCVASVPEGIKLEYGSAEFRAYEATGITVIPKTAFVLVAGGLGERLGYNGIKVAIPCEITTGMCFLELYISQILALQRLSGCDSPIPLAIMTSDDTHGPTLALLHKNDNFGMDNDQIVVLKQEKVAAISDVMGRIAMKPDDPFEIDTKPHGHGDIHTLLCSSGIAESWRTRGKEFIVFLQDTNPLAFTAAVSALGVSADHCLEINSVCLPRKAGEAVGVIAVLSRDDGWKITGNVEYNQLDSLLRGNGGPGDVNGANGWSPYPGNTNTLIYALGPYVEVLKRTSEFVNPKYADGSKMMFQRPTRLECMMQDHSRNVSDSAKVMYTLYPQWIYAPCKNSLTEAKRKYDAELPPQCAATAEMEVYESECGSGDLNTAGACEFVRCMCTMAANCRALRTVGVNVLTSDRVITVAGMTLPDPAHVVLHATFAITLSQLATRFHTPECVKITANSTVVLRGDVIIHHLDVDGTVVIEACDGAVVEVKRLTVRNGGWFFRPIGPEDTVSSEIAVRGYQLHRTDERVFRFTVPGRYVIDE